LPTLKPSSSAKAAPTFASSSRAGTPECGVKTRQSFLALIGLSLRLTFRRWPLYAGAVAIAFGLQALAAFVLRSPTIVEVSEDVALALLTALVYARVWGDSNEGIEPGAVWERFLERAWAVIVIDFALSEVLTKAMVAAPPSSVPAEIAGIVAVGAVLFFLFADAGAVVDDGVTVWTVIPRAFLHSAIVTLNLTTFARALALFSIELLLLNCQLPLYFVLVRFHVAQPLFWSVVPLATIVQPPLAALTLLIYQDAKAAA
jgi:hypothetical protein